nr:MAG TPA: hypothetical protein [Bacteriophage sp.]
MIVLRIISLLWILGLQIQSCGMIQPLLSMQRDMGKEEFMVSIKQ